MTINKQAKALNSIIEKDNAAVFSLLSQKGRAIFFPKEGIVAQAADAKGKKINATIGAAIEDDGTPMRLPSIAKYITIDPKDAFAYAPSYGKPELRKLWQELIYKKSPCLKAAISLPVVTQALTHGLSMVGYLFVDPGDEIIMTDKFWGNYRLIFENAYGGVINTFNTFKNNSFDSASFRAKLQEKKGKKIILLNFPNNPAGYTPTIKEAQLITNIIHENAKDGNQIVVICDDAYFGLVYKEGIYQESFFSKLADLHENILAIKIDGATKEEYVWGFRVGFITYGAKGLTKESYNALEAKTAGAVRGSISNASNLSQSLIYQGMLSSSYEQEKRDKYKILKSRCEAVERILQDEKYAEYFWPLPFNSGYFMCLDLKEGLQAEAIRQQLLKNYDTGIIATNNLIRLAFSGVKEADLKQLFDNIYSAIKDLYGPN